MDFNHLLPLGFLSIFLDCSRKRLTSCETACFNKCLIFSTFSSSDCFLVEVFSLLIIGYENVIVLQVLQLNDLELKATILLHDRDLSHLTGLAEFDFLIVLSMKPTVYHIFGYFNTFTKLQFFTSRANTQNTFLLYGKCVIYMDGV